MLVVLVMQVLVMRQQAVAVLVQQEQRLLVAVLELQVALA
jgi:hypothetical protein